MLWISLQNDWDRSETLVRFAFRFPQTFWQLKIIEVYVLWVKIFDPIADVLYLLKQVKFLLLYLFICQVLLVD